MKFRKTVRYKLKHLIPMLTIAGATLFPATSCEKAEPHHNTTYIWGAGNWDAVNPKVTDNVAKSADSTSVDYVFLMNDGNSLQGMYTSSLVRYMTQIVESVSQDKRNKVRGAGTLLEAAMQNKEDIQDSIKLAQFGFSFDKVVYGSGFQR